MLAVLRSSEYTRLHRLLAVLMPSQLGSEGHIQRVPAVHMAQRAERVLAQCRETMLTTRRQVMLWPQHYSAASITTQTHTENQPRRQLQWANVGSKLTVAPAVPSGGVCLGLSGANTFAVNP